MGLASDPEGAAVPVRSERVERAQGLADALTKNGVSAIALTFVDNAGLCRVKAVPTYRLPEAASLGIGMSPVFDHFLVDDTIASGGSPVGDLRLFPDLERLRVFSAQPGWAWAPVNRYDQAGHPYSGCQRAFARRLAEASSGHRLEVQMGFEVEWAVGSEDDDGNFVPACDGPAYGMGRLTEMADYLRAVHETLARDGVGVLQVHPEYAPGQFEVSFAPSDPVSAADDIVFVGETIRAVTIRQGLRASFGPLVTAGGVGNGGHVHIGLRQDGLNLLSSGDGPYGMTREGEAFLAAVLYALPALLAIGAPSPASHARLVPSHWAGVFQCWGRENREAALRLVTGPDGERAEAANAEIKCFDQAANPYLVVGAILAVGMSGLGDLGRLPDEVSLDPASLDEPSLRRLGISRLPNGINEALSHLEASEVLRSAMGSELFDAFVAVRRAEFDSFAGASDRELARRTRWRY